MGRNCEMVLIDDQRPRAGPSPRSLRRASCWPIDGAKVTKGQKLAEWDPYTLPIITEREGIANYVDLVEGVSMREVMDETTGISNRVVIDWKQQPRGNDLKPRITLTRRQGQAHHARPTGSRRATSCRWTPSSRSRTARRCRPATCWRAFRAKSSKTRDITGGLPRVAELFEARKPKDFAIISEIDGRVEFGKDYKTKRRIVVRAGGCRASEPQRVSDPEGQAHQRPGRRLCAAAAIC